MSVLIDGKPITLDQIKLDIPMSAFTLFNGPECANDLDYVDDCAFFRENAGRNLVIRRAVSEFAENDKQSLYGKLGINLPPLWVLIRQESRGFHTIQAVWRGVAHWPVRSAQTLQEYDACASDDAVLTLYRQFKQMGGMSKPCMERLFKQGDEFAAKQMAAQQPGGLIH